MKNRLGNNKTTITPSEVNKFLYCPYQWYYERLYGKKEISRRLKERTTQYSYSAKAKHKPRTQNNFARGVIFHERFGRYERLFQIFRRILLAIVAVALVLAILFLYSFS